jgi:death-on-curing protein
VTDPVEYLELDDLISLARKLLGTNLRIRDIGLLGSAVARPQTTVFGEDAYSDLWTKAAALLQSIVKNHALVDGNNRLGWLACAVFLELNGVTVTNIPNDDVFRFVMDVTVGTHEIDELAAALRHLLL